MAAADILKARGLDIGFQERVVVSGIDFSLSAGQAMALIGTNGSGKSTLLKTIVGLIPPLRGKIQIFGNQPGNNARRIAYLGQFHASGFILPLRAIDVVGMGRYPLHGLLGRMKQQDEEIIWNSLRLMGIEALAQQPLRNLSGGQQQRTYLAQVLAHRAELLVLDEPTTGLDAGGRELYLHAMSEELCRGASIIMATHDIEEEAMLCQKVMLLARKVVAIGPPEEVITPETLRETFGIVVNGGRKPAVLECGHSHEAGQP